MFDGVSFALFCLVFVLLSYNGRIISGEISGGSCLVVLAHTKWNHSMELFGIFFGCIARAVVAAAGKRFF